MNSAISQTASNINLSVDQKLTNYSTTSEMNAAIDVKANQITSTVSSTYATKTELNTAKTEIRQTTDSISLTVSQKMNSSDFNQAQIIAQINDGTSQVKIRADNINLSGYLTVSSASGTYATKSGLSNGTTTINGACLTTGVIKSSNYEAGTTGMAINLSSGAIDGKNFRINPSGNVTVNGTITSSNVTLTGGTIKSANYQSDTSGTLINLANGSIDSKNFKVSSNGSITASNATISGSITATSGTIGGCTISNGVLTVESANIRSINGSQVTGTGTMSGSIISTGSMSGNRITNGTITGNKISVDAEISCGKLGVSGTVTCADITADAFYTATLGNYGGFYCNSRRGQSESMWVITGWTEAGGGKITFKGRDITFTGGIITYIGEETTATAWIV